MSLQATLDRVEGRADKATFAVLRRVEELHAAETALRAERLEHLRRSKAKMSLDSRIVKVMEDYCLAKIAVSRARRNGKAVSACEAHLDEVRYRRDELKLQLISEEPKEWLSIWNHHKRVVGRRLSIHRPMRPDRPVEGAESLIGSLTEMFCAPVPDRLLEVPPLD